MDERYEALEHRVAELEREVRELKREAVPLGTDAMERGQPLVRKLQQPADLQAILKSMGIEHCTPIGAEQLQQLLLDAGIRPEDNAFSRGIIEMREE